jgi:hypothetical protein
MHDRHPEDIPCTHSACDAQAHRDYRAEHGGSHNGAELYCDHNPYDPGVGAELHPDQIAETNAYIERRGFQGVHFELTPDGLGGRAMVTSQKGWKAYAESVGTFNKDAGYGDPQPGVQRRPSGPEFVTIGE